MNKTRRRAVQKHRAKEIKFEIRRKRGESSAGGAGRSKPSTAAAGASTAATQPAAKPRAIAKKRETAEAAEE